MDQYVAFITNHWILSSLFGTVLLALFLTEFVNQSFGIPEVSPEQAVHLMNHQSALVLDIRTPNAFLEGHIIDAHNVPSSTLESKMATLQKYKEKPIIVVCVMGNEARRIGTKLKREGFQAVVLAGGFQAWKSAGLPLVKSK